MESGRDISTVIIVWNRKDIFRSATSLNATDFLCLVTVVHLSRNHISEIWCTMFRSLKPSWINEFLGNDVRCLDIIARSRRHGEGDLPSTDTLRNVARRCTRLYFNLNIIVSESPRSIRCPKHQGGYHCQNTYVVFHICHHLHLPMIFT